MSDRAFEKHLDGCEHCRTHPFDLCGVGFLLLKATPVDDAIPAEPTTLYRPRSFDISRTGPFVRAANARKKGGP